MGPRPLGISVAEKSLNARQKGFRNTFSTTSVDLLGLIGFSESFTFIMIALPSQWFVSVTYSAIRSPIDMMES
jgi:hypothetical protein